MQGLAVMHLSSSKVVPANLNQALGAVDNGDQRSCLTEQFGSSSPAQVALGHWLIHSTGLADLIMRNEEKKTHKANCMLEAPCTVQYM